MTDPIPSDSAKLREPLRMASSFSSQSMRTAAIGVLRKEAANALSAILDQLDDQAAEIEKWQRLALVAEEITDARISDLLEHDAQAKGMSFSDAAAVFLRKATRLQHERDVVTASRDDLNDERNRLAAKCDAAEARVAELEGLLIRIVGHSPAAMESMAGCALVRRADLEAGRAAVAKQRSRK